MGAAPQPGSLGGLSDDQLGTIAVSLVISELRWTPDVAPAVMDRISRDAVAYPEHFDRRGRQRTVLRRTRADEPSLPRTLGRIAVLAVIIVLVAALVVVAATADAAGLDIQPAAFQPVTLPVPEAP